MGGIFSLENPFWHFMNKLLALVLLNLLWILCSLPVFTIGASTTAVYHVTLKLVKNQEGYISKDFFHGFKANFKQATVIWLILMAVGAFLTMDLSVYLRSTSTGPLHFILLTAFFSVTVAYFLECTYVFPLLAQFDNTLKRTMINAVLMALQHLPSSILMLASDVLILAIGFLFFPPLLFLGFGLMAFIHSWFLVKIFAPYKDQ